MRFMSIARLLGVESLQQARKDQVMPGLMQLTMQRLCCS
jgi:hypothetical protein